MARSLSLWLLGLWLGALVASWAVATVNFRTVDRVLGPGIRPEIATRLAGLPAEERRMVLRHLASEINRWIFRWWTAAQVVLGLVVLITAWSSGPLSRAAAALALALVLIQGAALAPSIVDLGRRIDFLPRPLPIEVGRRFGLLHGLYVGADLLKALLLAAAAWAVARPQAHERAVS